MKSVMRISRKKMMSIVFLLAIIFIALALSSVSFLINNNESSLPNVGLEGNKNMKDKEVGEEHMKDKKAHTKDEKAEEKE